MDRLQFVVSGMVLPYSQSVNPRDVIAGMLSKKGYIILNELDDRFRHETVIVNYGESNRRNFCIGWIYYRSNSTIYFGFNRRIGLYYNCKKVMEVQKLLM